MSIEKWLIKSRLILVQSDIPTARLDVEVLLSDALSKDRSWILAHPEFELSVSQIDKLDSQIARRQNHEPIAYIRGRQQFYGRDFYVTRDTLTPRPETETLIEKTIEILKTQDIKSVSDIGTGSGCIAITLDLETKEKIKYSGYDISKKAILVAKRNAENLKAEVDFFVCDITKNKKSEWQKSDLITANLPYVPTDFHINLSASHEPGFAIFGGADGLDYYRVLFSKLITKKCVITESMPTQHKEMLKIAKQFGFRQTDSQDFIQVFSNFS